MDFNLPKDLLELKERVRKYIREEVVPFEKDWPAALQDAPEDKVKILKEKAEEAGLVSITVPKEFGGQGLGTLAYCIICEEASQTNIPVLFIGAFGPFHGVHPELYTAPKKLQDKYLWPVLNGETDWGVAFTEWNAGSDLAAMEATAVKDGENYILNGTKIFASKSADAGYMVVGAYTDKSKGPAGMSTFIVDTDTPGFNVKRWIHVIGGWREEVIELKDCVVPAENMIGGESKGFKQAMNHFNLVGRIGTAAQVLGMAERSLEEAVKRLKTRKQFGKYLAEFQGLQWMVADSRVDIETMKWLVYSTAWKVDQGEDIRLEAAMTKLHCVYAANRVVDHAIQICGGMGLSTDLPLAYFYDGIRKARVAEGTMEIMRLIISRQLLGRNLTG